MITEPSFLDIFRLLFLSLLMVTEFISFTCTQYSPCPSSLVEPNSLGFTTQYFKVLYVVCCELGYVLSVNTEWARRWSISSGFGFRLHVKTDCTQRAAQLWLSNTKFYGIKFIYTLA